MAINRKHFFDTVRLTLFGGKLATQQVAGLAAILDKWEKESPDADDRWLAYMLGTAHHETGRTMQPVRETFAASDDQAITRLNSAFAKGVLTWVSRPYWQVDAEGKSWLGRGYVQITHKANYLKLKGVTGIDLTGNPTRAMEVPVALDIMFKGMRQGSFTGRKLGEYFTGAKQDWRSARKIINGLERADLVADCAKQYYSAISYTTG